MSGDDQNIGRLVAGRYRLDSLLGKGGFGSVYKGWDTQIGRDVAVKLLDVMNQARSAQQQSELAERFRREAMAAGRINHPSIVTIYDFGLAESDGEAYLVMEFLQGHDLADELKNRGPILPPRALRLFVPLVEALGKGHELGIVHKDIKPQNIFLRHPGSAGESMCLVDFGVARVVHEDKLTLTGLIVGTPQYMAPEYITETMVTPALDVYQMGLILAEIITGVPAVPTGESFVKSCNRHFTGELQIPEDLYLGEFGAVLKKALQPNPNDRFETATEFAKELARVDASKITIDSHETAVFQRAGETPTFEEPPLYPPMRPDEVSAELAREEAVSSSASFAQPHTAPQKLRATANHDSTAETPNPLPGLAATKAPAMAFAPTAATPHQGPAGREYGAPHQSSDAHPNPLHRAAAPPARQDAGPPPGPPPNFGKRNGAPGSTSGADEWSWSNAHAAPSAKGLSSASEASSVSAPSRGIGLGLVVAAFVLVLGVAVAAAFAWVVYSERAATQPAVDQPPVPTPAPLEPAPIVAEAMGATVLSEPSGANVTFGDRLLGTTPLELPDGLVGETLTITLDGHAPRDVVATEDNVTVELVVTKDPADTKEPQKAARPVQKKVQRDPPKPHEPTLSAAKLEQLKRAAESATELEEPGEDSPDEDSPTHAPPAEDTPADETADEPSDDDSSPAPPPKTWSKKRVKIMP